MNAVAGQGGLREIGGVRAGFGILLSRKGKFPLSGPLYREEHELFTILE
jgi:hypothetical protein